MNTVLINRNNMGFGYKPNIFTILDNEMNLPNVIMFSKTVKKSPAFKTEIVKLDENDKEYTVENPEVEKLRKLLIDSHLKYFNEVTLKHPRLVDMLNHVKEKAFVLPDFAVLMNCVCLPDHEIPFDDPTMFDDDFRTFLNHYIPLVEGENELTLEWVQTTIKQLCTELNMKVKNVSIKLQMAVTGEKAGISGWHVMSWIGPSSTIRRLNRAYFYNLTSFSV